MPREERMFGDIVDPSIKMGSKQGASVMMTILLEAAIIAAIVIAFVSYIVWNCVQNYKAKNK